MSTFVFNGFEFLLGDSVAAIAASFCRGKEQSLSILGSIIPILQVQERNCILQGGEKGEGGGLLGRHIGIGHGEAGRGPRLQPQLALSSLAGLARKLQTIVFGCGGA